MNRLPLAQVTLCAVDTRAPALAAEAMLRSMAQVQFGRAILFTHQWLPRVVIPELEVIEIGPIGSGAEYSQFVMRRLAGYVRSSHALIVQWDGFVADVRAWSDEFLVHDYIGAVWPDQPEGLQVGNGGFSLRSRRMLLAGQDLRITEEHPEDEVLCRTWRRHLEQVHGIRFAPPELARRFAVENEGTGDAFGFHGCYHLPRVLDEPGLLRWLAVLPDEFFRGRDARRLARALVLQGMPHAAQQVVRRREAVGRTEPSTRVWGAAASVLGLFASRPG